jgi:hypothetical protein
MRPRPAVGQDDAVARSRSTKSASTSTAALRQFLLRQDPGWLVDQLLRIAEEYPLVAAHLQAASGADRTGLVDLSGLRRELASAIQPSWYVEYGAVAGYAHGIDRVLDEVQRLIDEGFPEAAIEAAEYALTLLEDALGQVDDSDGEMGSLAGRAQEIHLAACEQARPDAVELASGWPGGRCAVIGRSFSTALAHMPTCSVSPAWPGLKR